MERSVCSPSTMTVAGGGTTGIITVHRTLTSFKPCVETPNQYHRRYPCNQQEGAESIRIRHPCCLGQTDALITERDDDMPILSAIIRKIVDCCVEKWAAA